MRLGFIFKPAFRKQYGYKKEFSGNKITTEDDGWGKIKIECIDFNNQLDTAHFPKTAIQLIYFTVK